MLPEPLKEADSLWVDGKYDLLVLDVSLPDGTGFEFLQKGAASFQSPHHFFGRRQMKKWTLSWVWTLVEMIILQTV